MEAINKELEILNSLLGFKIQTFRKGLSNEESKRLEHVDITIVFRRCETHPISSSYTQNILQSKSEK